MDKKPALAIAIHDLNSHGGHERSTWEITRYLQDFFRIRTYTYSLEKLNSNDFSTVESRFVHPNIRGPALIKISYYYLASLFFSRSSGPILATGACSLVSDIVQVQFVNKRWAKVAKVLPPELYRNPGERDKLLALALFRRFYHWALLKYNIFIENLVYRPNKTYIAISNAVKRELEEEFGLRNVRVIPHGVNPAEFYPASLSSKERDAKLRSSLGLLADDFIIIFVGAYERKGLAAAIKSVAHLESNLKQKVKILAVGSGDTRAFQRFAERNGIAQNLVCIPNQKNIADYYRIANLFLLPTLYEPFGLVILEAMACGVVPVVSACAGAAEFIKDGTNGFLIKNPNDTQEIAAILRNCLENHALIQELGVAAQRVAQNRSWQKVAMDYAAIIQEWNLEA